MLMLPALLAGLLIALITCQTAMANPATLIERLDTQHHPLRLERLADSLNHPWSMAFLEDGDILIAERPGNLVKLDAQGTLTRIDGLPDVSQHGQGGLLDLALHPAYGAGNDWLYFTWSQPGSGGTSATTLSRARLDENALNGQVVEQERILDGEIGRIRAVSQGPDGAIYLLEDAPQGALYRLTPATD